METQAAMILGRILGRQAMVPPPILPLKITVRKYKIPCLLSETSVVYQEGRVFGPYTVAHCRETGERPLAENGQGP